MQKAQRGEFPLAVPFDDPGVEAKFRNNIWPEQFIVSFAKKAAGEDIWTLVENETWCGKTKGSHDDVVASAKKYYEAKGFAFDLKRILFC